MQDLTPAFGFLRLFGFFDPGFFTFEVPLPPENQRAQIAAFLEIQSAKLDTLTVEAQRAIDLLQERRTALISAAVTGQIDVRPLAQVLKVGAGETAILSGESSTACGGPLTTVKSVHIVQLG